MMFLKGLTKENEMYYINVESALFIRICDNYLHCCLAPGISVFLKKESALMINHIDEII